MFSARYQFVGVSFLGILINYVLRVNINLVITSMVNRTALTTGQNVTHSKQDGIFVWDSIVQADVMGIFFAGYVAFQLTGGRLAELFGGKLIMLTSVGSNILLTFLTPLAAKLSGPHGYPYCLVILRFLMGMLQAITFPCSSSMLARWAPHHERSTMTTISYIGVYVGIVVGFFGSGLLADIVGWENVFYIEGGVSLLWLPLWYYIVADSPTSHPRISKEEREYILSGLPENKSSKIEVPWVHLLKSLPFWSIFVVNFASGWILHLVMTELPQFLKHIFPAYMNSSARIGMWLAIPFACSIVMSLLASFASDFLIRTNKLTTASVRKLMTLLSIGGPAVCLIVLASTLTEENKESSLVLTLAIISTSMFLKGADFSGWVPNPQDIAPNFAGTIFGITNTMGSVAGFVAPAIAGSVINGNETSVEKWKIVWGLCCGFQVLATAFYLVFADGKPQHWNSISGILQANKHRDLVIIGVSLVAALASSTYTVSTMLLHGLT